MCSPTATTRIVCHCPSTGAVRSRSYARIVHGRTNIAESYSSGHWSARPIRPLGEAKDDATRGIVHALSRLAPHRWALVLQHEFYIAIPSATRPNSVGDNASDRRGAL